MKSVFYFATGNNSAKIRQISKKHGIATVCEEARCPNRGLCWENLSATFLILGPVCTRSCRFCYVKKGKPLTPDYNSIPSFAKSLAELGLKYYTFTMVTRDDLPDQGVNYLISLFYNLKNYNNSCYIEILTNDLEKKNLDNLLRNDLVDVFAHNLETVERLTPIIRDRRFSYRKSLEVLYNSKQINPKILTKSALIVGFGEKVEELESAMDDLRKVSCDALTIGQYFRPSLKNIEVNKIYSDEEFKFLEELAKSKGFKFAKAGKNVRTSYKAYELVEILKNINKNE